MQHHKTVRLNRFRNLCNRFQSIHALALGSLLAVSRLPAQASFTVLTEPIHYETYPHWQCAAALNRISDSVKQVNPIWIDTFPIRKDVSYKAEVPPIVEQVANRCGHRETIIDFDRDLGHLSTILLYRNDIDSVLSLMHSAVDTWDSSAVMSRFDRILSVVRAYIDVLGRPLLSDIVFQTILDRSALSPYETTALWVEYYKAAKARELDSIASIAAERTLKSAAQMEEGSERLRAAVSEAFYDRYLTELVDSLRTGGRSVYLKHVTYLMRDLKPFHNSDANRSLQGVWGAIGAQAQPLTPAYWIPDAPSQPIPTKGVVSLLIFLDNKSHKASEGVSREPFGMWAVLHRLKQQFPELDITVTSRTAGWIGHALHVDKQSEGTAIARWLLDGRKLPVRVAIDSTPFFHIDGLDQRRVNMASPIDESYDLGIMGMTGPSAGAMFDRLIHGPVAFLLDQSGTVIYNGPMNRISEARYASFIETLMELGTREINR